MVRAAFYEQFGEADVLRVGEVPDPPLGSDCVLVEVAAVGLNPVDNAIRRGYVRQGLDHFFPIVPGWDVAGTVTATGADATEFEIGDRVFGYARLDHVHRGTLAERVALPVRVLAHAPTEVDLITAGAVPLAGLTAYQLVRRLEVTEGETVLVHAASGGVGHFVVQLACLMGARVIGTASAANHDFLRSLGAEPALYGPSLPDEVRALAPDGVDVVIDLAGNGALDQSDDLMSPKGRVGSITDGAGAQARGGMYLFVRPSSTDLAELARLIDAGDLVVQVARTYPLADVVAAYRELETGHVTGKIVITVP